MQSRQCIITVALFLISCLLEIEPSFVNKVMSVCNSYLYSFLKFNLEKTVNTDLKNSFNYFIGIKITKKYSKFLTVTSSLTSMKTNLCYCIYSII